MASVVVNLFGQFRVKCGNQVLDCLKAQKSQELFCYLVLFRERSHNRECLAETLWEEQTNPLARKYLRKTIWQVQKDLEKNPELRVGSIFQVDANWIQFIPSTELLIDIIILDDVFESVRGVPGFELSQQQYKEVENAVQYYCGDLLEGCYFDWCIFERERLKEIYLTLVGKLMSNCEVNSKFEDGIEYGHKILSYERAHEQTHVRLMRLYYLSGNRTSAIRQYEICRKSLKQELDVEPSKRTAMIYKHIKNDVPGYEFSRERSSINLSEITLRRRLSRIKKILETQNLLYDQLPLEFHALEDDITKITK